MLRHGLMLALLRALSNSHEHTTSPVYVASRSLNSHTPLPLLRAIRRATPAITLCLARRHAFVAAARRIFFAILPYVDFATLIRLARC